MHPFLAHLLIELINRLIKFLENIASRVNRILKLDRRHVVEAPRAYQVHELN